MDKGRHWDIEPVVGRDEDKLQSMPCQMVCEGSVRSKREGGSCILEREKPKELVKELSCGWVALKIDCIKKNCKRGPMTSIKSIDGNISIPPNSNTRPSLSVPQVVCLSTPHLGIFQVDSMLVQSHTVLPIDWLKSVVNVTLLRTLLTEDQKYSYTALWETSASFSLFFFFYSK